MNDSELEDRLRTLRPSAASPALAARIQDDLASQSTPYPRAGVIAAPTRASFRWRLLRDLGWACAGAAAAVAIFAVFSQRKTAPVPTAAATAEVTPEDAFEHAGATQELVAEEDSEELIETADGPAREVRYSYLERHAWANRHTGARLIVEVPREDVYLMPLSLQ
jgi:hypothetical protein